MESASEYLNDISLDDDPSARTVFLNIAKHASRRVPCLHLSGLGNGTREEWPLLVETVSRAGHNIIPIQAKYIFIQIYGSHEPDFLV